MAKFRTNHSRQTRGRSATVVRLGVIAFLFFAGLLGYLWVSGGGWTALFEPSLPPARLPEHRFYLPESRAGEFWIHYPYHSVLMDSTENRAVLAASLLDVRFLKSADACDGLFISDPEYPVQKPASVGYSHLIYPALLPASDSSGLCFYSNLVELPTGQEKHWDTLQMIAKNWVQDAGQIYLVTGKVRDSLVCFWAGLDLRSSPPLAVGACLDSTHEIRWMSVDSLEIRTGLDFFPELMTDSLETALEATWPINQNFYLYDRN
jgi:hypothetical protein